MGQRGSGERAWLRVRGVSGGDPGQEESGRGGCGCPKGAGLKKPVHLITSAAGVGGRAACIIHTARGRSEEGLARWEKGETTHTGRGDRGLALVPHAGLVAVTGPMAGLATIVADPLDRRRGHGGMGGRGWGHGTGLGRRVVGWYGVDRGAAELLEGGPDPLGKV
jgi:hypothetical protein